MDESHKKKIIISADFRIHEERVILGCLQIAVKFAISLDENLIIKNLIYIFIIVIFIFSFNKTSNNNILNSTNQILLGDDIFSQWNSKFQSRETYLAPINIPTTFVPSILSLNPSDVLHIEFIHTVKVSWYNCFEHYSL